MDAFEQDKAQLGDPSLSGPVRACRLSPPDPPAVRRTVDDLPLGGMRWLQRGSSVHPCPLQSVIFCGQFNTYHPFLLPAPAFALV